MAVAEGLEVARFLKDQPKKLFIGGRWVEAASGKTFATLDPSTGEVLAQVAEGGAEDIDRAVAAARKAHESGIWRDLPPAERAKALWRVGDLIEERRTSSRSSTASTTGSRSTRCTSSTSRCRPRHSATTRDG